MAHSRCPINVNGLPTDELLQGEHDALDPFSTVSRSDNIADELVDFSDSQAATADEIADLKRVSLNAKENGTPFGTSVWAFEWRPNIQVGIVKLPFEKLANLSGEGNSSQFFLNILSVQTSDTERFSVDSSKSVILPMNTGNLVILEDVNLSRKLITNTTLTQGTKYYQVFTENFPEITISLSAVKYGGVSERVIKFFDMVTSFSGNPRKHPGSFYLYDVFKEQQEGFLEGLFRANHYKKYKIIPKAINKAVTSRDNMMVRITISGTVVEWEQDE